jgi:hypothetical protein
MEATAAVVPWAVLLIGFTLVYAMSRQGRPGHAPLLAAGDLSASSGPDAHGNGHASRAGTTVVPLSELLAVRPGPAADRGGAGGKQPTNAPATGPTDEPTATTPQPAAPKLTLPKLPRRRPIARDEPSDADAEPADPTAHFSRLYSSPTPPEVAPAPAAESSGEATVPSEDTVLSEDAVPSQDTVPSQD